MPITPALSAARMRRSLGVTTEKLANNSVTLGKIQQLQTDKFLGRTTAGTGNPEQVNQFLHMKVPGWTNGGHVTNFALLSGYLDGITRSNKNMGPGDFIQSFITHPAAGVISNQGSILAPNGKIYLSPNYDTVLRYLDPVTDTIVSYGQITKAQVNSPSTQGGVLAPNGKIYFIPEGGITLGLVVDPSNNSYTFFNSNGHLVFPANTNLVENAVLAPNGKIYVCCSTAAVGGIGKIVVIEPNNNNNCYTLTSTLPAATDINLGPNGFIYTHYNNVLYKIDPSTETITAKTFTGFPSGGIGVSHYVSASNGFFYLPPLASSSFMAYIDPFSETFSTYAMNPTFGIGSSVQGLLAPNGKIYCTPYNTTSIVVIDPEKNTVTSYAFPSISSIGADGFWLSSQISPQGNIYMDCFGAGAILKLSFYNNNNFNMNYLTCPFNNRGY